MNVLDRLINRHFSRWEASATQVRSAFQRENLAAGSYFLRQDQYWRRIALIQSGTLIDCSSHSGREAVHWIYAEGDFVADLQKIIEGGQAGGDFRATEDAVIYSLDGARLPQLRQLPGWNEMEQRLLSECALALRGGLAVYQTMNAQQRYDDLFERRPELFNRIPLKVIASYLNMSPETLSRIRKARATT